MFENRRWLIIPTDKINLINFNEIEEYDLSSLRYSIDKSKTFVKYDIEYNNIVRPSFFEIGLGEYNYSEILEILETEEWQENIKQE